MRCVEKTTAVALLYGDADASTLRHGFGGIARKVDEDAG